MLQKDVNQQLLAAPLDVKNAYVQSVYAIGQAGYAMAALENMF